VYLDRSHCLLQVNEKPLPHGQGPPKRMFGVFRCG
jgi:hypothetical protein